MIYLAAIVLFGPLLGLIPPLVRGRAYNSMFHIAMPDKQTTYVGYWVPVLAQELAEWWSAWLVAFLLAAGPAYLLNTYTPFGLASPLLAMAAWNWRSTPWGRRQLEYIGWAAEWVHGVKHAPERYSSLAGHAAQLTSGYRVFDGVTAPQALVRLKAAIPLARLALIMVGPRLSRLA